MTKPKFAQFTFTIPRMKYKIELKVTSIYGRQSTVSKVVAFIARDVDNT